MRQIKVLHHNVRPSLQGDCCKGISTCIRAQRGIHIALCEAQEALAAPL